MQFDDPQRRCINGLPAYGDPPIGVLPALQVRPLNSDWADISVMLACSPKEYRWYSASVAITELPTVMLHYYLAPEDLLKQLYKWEPPKGASPEPLPRAPTLEDLGL